MDIERYKKWCLDMEASGNHGSKGGPTSVSTVDTRRGIVFWGSGRGWQLKRDWRAQWAIKFPHVELPPKPELPARVRPLPRKKLEALVQEYKSYNPNVGHLEYWSARVSGTAGWRLELWKANGNDHRMMNIGVDTHEAARVLGHLIDQWKRDHNLTGQEPQVGGDSELTGQEPMIGGEG